MKLRAPILRFVEIVSANYWQTLPHFCTELLMLSVFFRLGQNMTIVKVKREDQEGKEEGKKEMRICHEERATLHCV